MTRTPSHLLETANSMRWPWVLALISGLFFYAARWQEVPIGAVTDDAFYIEMARSIAEGHGPVIATGPDIDPANPQIFPAGFPYLLSPLARLAPHSMVTLSMVPLFAALMTIVATWLLLARTLSPHLRLMTTLALVCNPWFISWSSRILSDVPYMAISLAAMFMILKADDQDYRRLKTLFFAVVLCAAAISVRTVGWAIVAASVSLFVIQKRWLLSVGFPLAVIVALMPTWFMGAHPSNPLTSAYNEQMLSNNGSALWQIIVTNTSGYLAELSVILVPIFGNPVSRFSESNSLGFLYATLTFGFGILALGLAYNGAKAGIRNQNTTALTRLISAYILFYTIALSVFDGYPSGVQTRLLIPLLPFLVWLILSGASAFNRRLAYWIFAAMILASLAHNTWRVVHPLRTSTEADGHGLVHLAQGVEWINDNSLNSDLFMTQEPLLRHIHWQRPAVHFPEQLTYDDLLLHCEKYAVRFVFLGPSVTGKPRALDAINQEMKRLLDTHPQRFARVLAQDQHSVFIYQFISSTP